MKYFIYDVIYICSSRKTFKHNYIFIIHHLFTAGLCYLGHDQKFGNGVFLMFETTTSPLLHIAKITQAIYPKYHPAVKNFTKEMYFLFRVLTPPFWILYKLLSHYNGSVKHTFILSGIFSLWQASIVWYRKML
jgi:hypothetical protein